ncbi:MAG: caspase family protein [Burkholderiales bacterium]|jgi:hypothetical protein
MKLHALAVAALSALLLMPSVRAESRALILTIDYAGTQAALPGIDKDAQLARKIATDMGVPPQNIRSMSNRDLTVGGLQATLSNFAASVRPEDNVFIYYSGHGAQVQNESGPSCVEGMVGSDLKLFMERDLTPLLQRIARTAARTVVLNDSCFSGGQYREKSADTRSLGSGAVPKLMDMKTNTATTDSGYQCGEAINKQFRSLAPVARQANNQFVYLAAASDREVAFATPSGSAATLAWSACLNDAAADTNGDGAISGTELQACAQNRVRRMNFNQTISLAGSDGMPVVYLGTAANSATGDQCRPTNLVGVLEGIRRSSNTEIELSITNPTVRIGKDLLDFSVRTPERGYLYLVHVGTRGEFHLLFPNKLDQSNEIGPGTHRFPRPAWGLQAQGPDAGASHLMAIMTAAPLNLDGALDLRSTFGKLDSSNCKATKSLGLVSRQGRLAASHIARIEEIK